MPKKIKRCEKCSRQFPKLEVVLIGNGTMTVEKEVAEEIWKLRRTIMAIELVIATNLDRK